MLVETKVMSEKHLNADNEEKNQSGNYLTVNREEPKSHSTERIYVNVYCE